MKNVRSESCTSQSQFRAISILGASLDVGNRGVLALGVSLARLLSQLRPEVPIAFHYGHSTGGLRQLPGEPTIEIQVLNCRRSPRSALSEHIFVILALALLYRLGLRQPARRNPWLRSLLNAQLVGDIRGGDSFSDIYGFRRFLEGSLPLLSVALLGRSYTLLPQTYGPFRLRASRWLAANMLRRASLVLTRDRNCERTVFALSGKSTRFCPDVAFTLQATKPRRMIFAPHSIDLESGDLVIGMNVSGLLYMGGYTRRNMFGLRSDYSDMIDRLVDRLLTSTSARVLLIPHTFHSESEEEACARILESAGQRHPGRVFMLTEAMSEREIKWVIGRTSFFVGSRMHACIAALSQCVPTVGLGYSDKFLGVFQSAGVGESIVDLRICDTAQLIDRVVLAFERRAAIVGRLQACVPVIQDEVESVFRELLSSPV